MKYLKTYESLGRSIDQIAETNSHVEQIKDIVLDLDDLGFSTNIRMIQVFNILINIQKEPPFNADEEPIQFMDTFNRILLFAENENYKFITLRIVHGNDTILSKVIRENTPSIGKITQSDRDRILNSLLEQVGVCGLFSCGIFLSNRHENNF